jgi:hypothetical protein
VVYEPTEEELIAFADSILSNLGDSLRDADLLHETVRENRELWLMLYQLSRNPADSESSSR